MNSVRKHVGTGFINLSSPWSLCFQNTKLAKQNSQKFQNIRLVRWANTQERVATREVARHSPCNTLFLWMRQLWGMSMCVCLKISPDWFWHPQIRGELPGQSLACWECLQPGQCRLWRFAISSWMRNSRASRMDGSRGVCADTSSLTLPGSSS